MPPSEGVLLEAVGIARAFGTLRVLDRVDLAVAAGETVAIVGPNGSGKTTLLRILAGLSRPSAGEVRVLGRRLDRQDSAARRPIGLLSHQSMLYHDLSVEENLRFTARLYRLPDAEGAVRRSLASVDLTAWRARRTGNLSRGLLQRAAIARALIHDPRVLLLDEPFTGLDAASSDRLRAVLRDQARAGRALILVTHQLAEAWDLASHVAVLAGGRLAIHEPRPADADAFERRYREVAGA